MSELPLPVDIPWKLIDVSSGMMKTGFCDGSQPPQWRPSVAVFAWEPDPEQVPHRCDTRVTYLKVSVTATGLQAPLTDDPQFDLNSELEFINDAGSFSSFLRGRYLACYGVLLNVSVFPEQDGAALGDYPHIVDFEPKNRELIQAVTQDGEALVGSASKVGTDRSFQQVSGTEIGLSHTGKYTSPESSAGKFEASHTISGKWTNTQTEQSSINTDASTERRERYATQTSLTQMYNLLSGYHLGTNRASFLMLPRPHTVQPTRFRTFVQGIRQIEGVQEFLLVVVSPDDSAGMRVEVELNTGHFPEQVPVAGPSTSYETRDLHMPVPVRVQGSGAVEGRNQVGNITRIIPLDDGWEVDPSRGDAGRGGVSSRGIQFSRGMHASDLKEIEYLVSDGRLTVTYRVERGLNAGDAQMTLYYDIHLRRAREFTGTGDERLGAGHFIGTRTRLCTQFTVEDGCVRRGETTVPPSDDGVDWVFESPVRLPESLARAPAQDFSRLSSAHALGTIQGLMNETASRQGSARPAAYAYTRSFSEELIANLMPDVSLGSLASGFPVLTQRFGQLGTLTLRQFMLQDVSVLAERLKTQTQAIVKARIALATHTAKQALFSDVAQAGQGFRLRLPGDILFAYDSSELSQQALDGLLAAARMIEAHPHASFRIIGHTDSRGSADYNQGLSERRAQAVAQALEQYFHISPDRMQLLGMGAVQPVAHNTQPDGSDSPEGRRLNRRVEIELVTSEQGSG
ncbi:MAG: OmpA family protein [Gammaproteobacteria bacterium]|nr:OmpA family protein [Gammaproteobacteria bacterium]